MISFLRACGVPEHGMKPWRRAWERVAADGQDLSEYAALLRPCGTSWQVVVRMRSPRRKGSRPVAERYLSRVLTAWEAPQLRDWRSLEGRNRKIRRAGQILAGEYRSRWSAGVSWRLAYALCG